MISIACMVSTIASMVIRLLMTHAMILTSGVVIIVVPVPLVVIVVVV